MFVCLLACFLSALLSHYCFQVSDNLPFLSLLTLSLLSPAVCNHPWPFHHESFLPLFSLLVSSCALRICELQFFSRCSLRAAAALIGLSRYCFSPYTFHSFRSRSRHTCRSSCHRLRHQSDEQSPPAADVKPERRRPEWVTYNLAAMRDPH